jgi:alkylation response protein AidB-like acyl-CoA dehydrogenase
MLDLATILARTREVAEDICTPAADRVDADGVWPEEALRALGTAGLMGLVIPPEYGGQGAGLVGLARVCEILAQACTSTALCFAMHSVGAAVLAARVGKDRADKFLVPIAEGRHVTAISLSEPGVGADYFFPHCSLHREGGELVIDGHKAMITNGGRADSCVISAVSREQGSVGVFSCVLLPGQSNGMHWGSPWDGFGMRGNSARDLTLRGVRVGQDRLIGDEGDELWLLFHVIAPHVLVALAATYLGAAQSAFDTTSSYVRRRRRPDALHDLAQVPVVQHKLGTMWAALERTRLLVRHAALEGDRTGVAGPFQFAAKAEAGDAALAVCSESMTLGGGSAYRLPSKVARLLRDIHAAPLMAPTTDMLRIWTGRALLGEPLLGD